jgi:hypothetical protein
VQLAEAIRTNAPSLAAAQSSYKQDVVNVNTLVNGVLSSALPTLNTTPPDWQAFVTAQEQAKSAALSWVNSVLARLLDVPDEVRDYNDIVTQLLSDAAVQARLLATDPSDRTALQILERDLSGLTSQLSIVTSFISGALTNIRSFQDQMPVMASQLQSIADKSIADSNADKSKIMSLNQQISALRSDIASLTAAIVALGIADAIAITLGAVATIAAWPVGALTWLVMGPVVAVATTYIALDAEKIKADKASIEALQGQITGLDADVATLALLAQNYGTMATQASALESGLESILSEWQSLELDVATAVSDIQLAMTDAQAASFGPIASEIQGALEAWNTAYAQAGTLHVDLNVNTAQLDVGMSPDQVAAALAAGTTVDVITYYNQMAV